MKTMRAFWGSGAVALALGWGHLAAAGPSLPVTKPPVQPLALLTGPMIDPAATNGQWFSDAAGMETVRTNEFHDDAAGGYFGAGAITGYVDSITFLGGPGTPIVAFTIQATIVNDVMPGATWSRGTNRHGETNNVQETPYVGALVDARLVAEFAIADTNTLPTVFQGPYRDRTNYVEALNEDLWAWYCWNPADPDQSHRPGGNFFVPAWDFGTIPIGQSATRKLSFGVVGGLPLTDSRYLPILQSFSQTNDVLMNRTLSLKVSTWIEEIALDGGAQQEEPPARLSDVSVFHDREEEVVLDFGDAPDQPYPTLLANDGARHGVVPGVCLGALIDSEADGQPDGTATGDDNNPPAGVDDEDGVTLPGVLVAGASVSVPVQASVPGFLNAWIDWNGNGTWIDPGEQVFLNWPLNPGLNLLPLSVPTPPALVSGGPHSRWRFTTYPPASPQYVGAETDGEVEDYEVRLQVLDFGDAPDPAYPTWLASDGARHLIPAAPIYYLGATAPDLDSDGQPTAAVDGDDLNGVDDEDGVFVPAGAPLVRGDPSSALGVICSTSGYLNAWLDFDGNGGWADAGERIASDLAMPAGFSALVFGIPAAAQVGPVAGRFRFASAAGLTYTGLAADGEVEDHEFTIYQNAPDTNAFWITNVAHVASNQIAIDWIGDTNAIYETQYILDLPSTTSPPWTAWGPWVSGPPLTQTDTNAASTAKHYRIVAPFSPPPP